MYLKRKADAYLNAWKSDPNRSPLIIKGPRQVGKTETIDYFAAHNYRSVVEINFVEEPNIAQSLRTVMARIPSSAIFP